MGHEWSEDLSRNNSPRWFLEFFLSTTILGVAPVDTSAKKRAIINFVKQKYTSIHLMCVRDQVNTQMDEFIRLMGQGMKFWRENLLLFRPE